SGTPGLIVARPPAATRLLIVQLSKFYSASPKDTKVGWSSSCSPSLSLSRTNSFGSLHATSRSSGVKETLPSKPVGSSLYIGQSLRFRIYHLSLPPPSFVL